MAYLKEFHEIDVEVSHIEDSVKTDSEIYERMRSFKYVKRGQHILPEESCNITFSCDATDTT